MRYSGKLTIVFLLALYIGPMILISSYGHTAILAEPNMTKDFSLADGEAWLDGWGFRREITISGTGGAAGTNYQMLLNVTYDSDMKSDFADIRFTDDDGETLLDHWRETYTASTFAVFWVEVADNLDISGNIYMYYGNSTVTDASNGTATFIMYEDWTSESVRVSVWDIVIADGSVSYSAVDANHGKTAKFDANAAATYKITSDYDTASPIAVMFRSNIEEATTGNAARQGSGYDGAFAFNLVETTATGEQFYVYDDNGNQDSQVMTSAYFDTWITFVITRDGTNSRLYADTTLIATASCEPDIITTNPAASIMVQDSEDDLYSDWVAVRKFVADEPIATIGDEELEVPPQWNEVGVANLLFVVLFDMWGFDTGLIILGLVMIPVSMLYLAYGVKHDRSNDRLFYGLILFFLGCGLFIGGVLP